MASQETAGCLPKPHCPLQLGLGLGGFWRVTGPKGEGGDTLLSSPQSPTKPKSGIREGQGVRTLEF